MRPLTHIWYTVYCALNIVTYKEIFEFVVKCIESTACLRLIWVSFSDWYYCVCIICSAGDGKLSYREFLAVMKRWKLRGYKVCEIIGGM